MACVPESVPGFGLGLTVIVKFSAVPVQEAVEGVTDKLATIGVVPVLTAVKGRIFPVPLAAKPIEG
jgi:hypothetical protein